MEEDEVDEILYMSRANEVEELGPYLDSLASKYEVSKDEIVASAVDVESGNTALHYASANGHAGKPKFLIWGMGRPNVISLPKKFALACFLTANLVLPRHLHRS